MQIVERTLSLARDVTAIWGLPRLTVNLMHGRTRDNHPFYDRLTRAFYRDAYSRHPKYLILRQLTHGVAITSLGGDFASYFRTIEGSARRNYKKALREGYSFSRIDLNDFLGDVTEIRRSSGCRQGKMPEAFLAAPARPVTNPESLSPYQDYPYFGVTRGGRLYAYAGCFLAGEVCLIEHIYGHADHQGDGIVPLLIISIAEYLTEHHTAVRYYGYGTFFGAGESMRRFKQKFGFTPHRVTWVLGD